jgi:hypothetical protein
MKKLIPILALLAAACSQPEKEIDPYHPTRPADVPDTTCDGTHIEWTWEKQRAYNEGKLSFSRDSSGCVVMVIRKIN